MDPNFPQALFILKGLNLLEKETAWKDSMSSSNYYPSILVHFSSCDKISGTGRKGCFSCQLPVHHAVKPRQETKAGTWRQEGKKPWSNTAHWLVFQARNQLSFLYRKHHLTRGEHHLQWAAPSHINQEMPRGLAYTSVSWRCFPRGDFLFPDESIFCQADNTKQNEPTLTISIGMRTRHRSSYCCTRH